MTLVQIREPTVKPQATEGGEWGGRDSGIRVKPESPYHFPEPLPYQFVYYDKGMGRKMRRQPTFSLDTVRLNISEYYNQIFSYRFIHH
jgi:hypothetical protein